MSLVGMCQIDWSGKIEENSVRYMIFESVKHLSVNMMYNLTQAANLDQISLVSS